MPQKNNTGEIVKYIPNPCIQDLQNLAEIRDDEGSQGSSSLLLTSIFCFGNVVHIPDSLEESVDNLCAIFDIIPQDLPYLIDKISNQKLT